jgi:hypothetical protein
MSDIDELRLRVEAAEERFGLADDRQRKYGARLLDIMNVVESGLNGKQTELERRTADLEKVTADLETVTSDLEQVKGENEQLRSMLHALLLAIESNSEDRLAKTMHSLDTMVSALTPGAAAAVTADDDGTTDVSESPEMDAAEAAAHIEPEETAEDFTDVTEAAEAAEAVEIAEATGADEIEAANEPEMSGAEVDLIEDEFAVGEEETQAETPVTEAAEEADAADPMAEGPVQVAEIDEPEVAAAAEELTENLAETELEAAHAENETAGALEAQEASEPQVAETKVEAEAEAVDSEVSESVLEKTVGEEPVAEAPETEAPQPTFKSPVGEIIERINQKTKDFPAEETVMKTLAEIEAGVEAALDDAAAEDSGQNTAAAS